MSLFRQAVVEISFH